MKARLHGRARTTPRVRAELEASKEKTSTLAERYGLSRTTVAKWRTRTTIHDAPMGPRDPRSTVLTLVKEAMVVEFRRRTLLPLDDVLGCLRDSVPKLTHSSLHRCLERHGIPARPKARSCAKKPSDRRAFSTNMDLLASSSSKKMALSTMFWFVIPTALPDRPWNVRRHLLMRLACSRTASTDRPPAEMPRRFS
jgi:hypothetical protein